MYGSVTTHSRRGVRPTMTTLYAVSSHADDLAQSTSRDGFLHLGKLIFFLVIALIVLGVIGTVLRRLFSRRPPD